MAQRPAVRFAPSPNGYLHLGHAYSALTVETFARSFDARMLLRIEDYDTQRSRPEYVRGILDDLDWLGIAYEAPVVRQSACTEFYRAAADRLQSLGVLYRCYASRAEIAAACEGRATDPDGVPLYPGAGIILSSSEDTARSRRGEPFALRIDMTKALAIARAKSDEWPPSFTDVDMDGRQRRMPTDPALWGDALLVRKDAPASYHLAVVIDDARQGITHVTRGKDLFAATDLHRLLQILLDLPQPVYHHHDLITAPDGRKLAKSKGDTSLASMRAEGVTAAAIRARLGFGPISHNSR